MRITGIAWGLVGIIAFCGTVRAQSLGDLARKEEERRKAVKTPSKVYTNDDLRRYPTSMVVAEPAPEGAQAAPPAAAGEAGAKPPAAGGRAADTPPSVDLGEAYWKKLIGDARGQLDRSTTYLDALQSRVNTLTAEFYAREDPVQRSTVWSQRMKVLDDMERLKQEMVEMRNAIAKIEDDARRANVPPGWIR